MKINRNVRITAAVLTICLASLTLWAAGALPQWNHTLNGSVSAVYNFAVFSDSGFSNGWSSGASETVSSLPFTETYYLKNTGNSALNISASDAVSGSVSLLDSWGSQNWTVLAPGGTGSLTLSLSYISGTGSYSVGITISGSAPAI